MPKIVLIQLPSPFLINDRDLPLLGTLYLASALRANNLEVQVADLCGLDEAHWYIPEGDVYGISLVTPQVPYARRLVELLRGRTSHPVTILGGGPHVSALPEWSLQHLGFDHVFVGEADTALPAFLARSDVAWPRVISCEPIKATKILLPARDLVDMRSFHRVGVNRYVTQGRYEGYLQTGRGCPFDCAFCAQSAITQRQIRYLPIPTVLQDLDDLLTRYECDLVFIEDDTFNISKKRVLALCAAFESVGFHWHCLCRSDTMDQETADALARAGCQNVAFGFESGSDEMLRSMGKGETVAQSRAAIACVKRAGMSVRGQMIVGFPGETQETVEQTAEFVRSTPVDRWGFHNFTLLPGSRSWKEALEAGRITLDAHTFDSGMETIGLPLYWSPRSYEHPETREWLRYLCAVAEGLNIYEELA